MGFFLAHEHSDFTFLAISEQLQVADSAFFPLIITEPVQLSPHLKNAFEAFVNLLCVDFGNIDLKIIYQVHLLQRSYNKR